MAYIVMAYVVLANAVMAYIAMAHVVMAYTVMAPCSDGLYSHSPCSYGLQVSASKMSTLQEIGIIGTGMMATGLCVDMCIKK